jgi:uncharacterized membrane protein YcaP (DUF421 family)
MDHHLFFHSWLDIGRVVLFSTLAYLLIVALLRVVGQQAMAKMSGYDLVATVTFGSIVAAIPLLRVTTFSEATAALLAFVALQEITRWLQSRWLPIHHLVREPPRVILWNGQLLEDRLRESNVSADEVRAAVRKAGHASFDSVRLVVLENDGDWSVIARGGQAGDDSALLGLAIPETVVAAPPAGDDSAQAATQRRLP